MLFALGNCPQGVVDGGEAKHVEQEDGARRGKASGAHRWDPSQGQGGGRQAKRDCLHQRTPGSEHQVGPINQQADSVHFKACYFRVFFRAFF